MKEGWREFRLEDISTKIGSGATPRGGNNAYKSEGITLIRSLNVYDAKFHEKGLAFIDEQQAAKLSNVVVQEDDILLNITGASIARCCVVPSKFLPARVNQHVSIIRPKQDIVDASFLATLLTAKEYKNRFLYEGDKAGATRQALTKAQLQGYTVILPPLPEQKRIVSILDEAFAGIDQAITNTEKNLANARELFESYLNNVFTQKGDGWVECKISDLVDNGVLDKPKDGNHGNIHPKKADFVESGVPFIMAANLINGEVDQQTCNFISRQQGDSLQKGFSKDGDVLLSHKGTIGRVAILSTKKDYVMLTPQVTYYRILNKGVLLNRYLYYFFQSPSFKSEMGNIAGIGSTRAYIGITKQLELTVRYPEIESQMEIAEILDSLYLNSQHLQSLYKQKLNSLNELKQSILQKAFTGELTKESIH